MSHHIQGYNFNCRRLGAIHGSRVPYHFYIRLDGTIFASHRWIKQLGGGDTLNVPLNCEGVSISVEGDLRKKPMQKVQENSFFALANKLWEDNGHPLAMVHASVLIKGSPSSNCPGQYFPYKKYYGEFSLSQTRRFPVNQSTILQVTAYNDSTISFTEVSKEGKKLAQSSTSAAEPIRRSKPGKRRRKLYASR
jgi:hypothetical protein